LSSYLDVDIVRILGCITHVPEQRVRGNGKLRARDLVCGRFVAHARGHHLYNDQLGFGPRSGAQMFEYGEAILVCPVVEHSAKEEDSDAL